MGAAILDYQTKGKAGKLSILSSMFEEDEMPVKHLFRNLEEMPMLEQKALSLAKGKVLDVGAGAGCHALALQAQSIAVKAIDISPQSCQAMLNETGFATPNKENFALHFFIKDHLGNVRILTDSKGNVEQAIDYYPFGSVIAEGKDSERQPYFYNGKELDRMNGLDWYDYGARMYENDGLRWGQIDPRAENTPEVSPYVYCNNNPIRRLDYRGMFYGDYYDNNGQLLGNDGRNDQKVYVIRAKSSTLTFGELTTPFANAEISNLPIHILESVGMIALSNVKAVILILLTHIIRSTLKHEQNVILSILSQNSKTHTLYIKI